MAIYERTKGRSEERRVREKTQREKQAGARSAKINNKKASLKTKAKQLLDDSAVNFAKNKNVTPAYRAGYVSALKQMGIKNDAAFFRNKAEKRVQKKGK